MQYKSFFLSLICLGAVAQAQAELKVIGDFGGESAVRFYEALQPDESNGSKPTLTVFLQH